LQFVSCNVSILTKFALNSVSEWCYSENYTEDNRMNTKHLLIGAALAGLTLSTTTACSPNSGEAQAGECHGVNSCKGTGACGGAGHDCSGKNECKGKGWVKSSPEDCTAKGGNFVDPKAAKEEKPSH
jgi:hypothetical protein